MAWYSRRVSRLPGAYLFMLLWFAYVLATGVHLFSRGFLLSRTALPDRSACAERLHACADPQNASCLHAAHLRRTLLADPHAGAAALGATCLPAKSRVILLVVDALRYDFGLYDRDNAATFAYQNQMPVLDALLREQPQRTRLLRFRADPPTTTLQRLKGLTTGSLPTFIDVGANFATDEINEDNIVDQLVRSGGRAVFMGDDTWTKLYPGRFERSHPMASFNIYDLDTVDEAVARLLAVEQRTDDWQLLVAHTLGVDHCGHRHGPQHPEMARKLSEVNALVTDIVERMRPDETLLVIGDHGMTASGDHGGESADEVTALLFAYTKAGARGFHRDETTAGDETMSQVDLVPTLAAILGVPIPYASLGQINYDLLPDTLSAEHQLTRGHEFLWHSLQNVHQMRRYQRRMAAERGDGSSEAAAAADGDARLQTIVHRQLLGALNAGHLDDAAAMREFHAKHVRPYLVQMTNDFAAVWVNFDATLMTYGLLFVGIASLLWFLVVNNVPAPVFERRFTAGACASITVANVVAGIFGWWQYELLSLHSGEQGWCVLSGMLNLAIVARLCVGDFDRICATLHRRSVERGAAAAAFEWRRWLVRALFVGTLAVAFSNSFVVNEQHVLASMVAAVLVVQLGAIDRTHMQFDLRRRVTLRAVWRSQFVRLLGLAALGVVAVRVASGALFRCREEQVGACEVAGVTASGGEGGGGGGGARVGWTCVALVAFAWAVGHVIDRVSTQRGGVAMRWARRGLTGLVTLHALCTWAMPTALPHLRAEHVDAVAWLAAGVVAAQAAYAWLWQPLLVYCHGQENEAERKSVQAIYQKLRDDLNRAGAEKETAAEAAVDFVQIPMTEGLQSAYTAVLVAGGFGGGMLVALVLGGQAAGGVVVVALVAGVQLVLGGVRQFQQERTIERCLQPSFTTLFAWTLLAHFAFYATGHQPTLSQIDWHAAFVGRRSSADEAASQTGFMPIALVLVNTFGATALLFALYPLLCVSVFTLFAYCGDWMPRARVTAQQRLLESVRMARGVELGASGGGGASTERGSNGAGQPPNHMLDRQHAFEMARGELNVFEAEESLFAAAFGAGSQLMVLQGFRIFASMLACTIHCRHLMVWKIFAPRFVYEALGTYAMLAAVPVGFAVLLRCHVAIGRLVRSVALDQTVFERLELLADGADVREQLKQRRRAGEQSKVEQATKVLERIVEEREAKLARDLAELRALAKPHVGPVPVANGKELGKYLEKVSAQIVDDTVKPAAAAARPTSNGKEHKE